MEVAPAVLPDLGPLGPAPVGAGEQHLQGLGEGGLARAVPPHHEGQAGGGLQGERDRWADAPEALDLDGGEVGGGGGLGGVRDWSGGWLVAVQDGPEGVGPLEGGQDQVCGVVDVGRRLGEARRQQALESQVGHSGGESGRGHGRLRSFRRSIHPASCCRRR